MVTFCVRLGDQHQLSGIFGGLDRSHVQISSAQPSEDKVRRRELKPRSCAERDALQSVQPMGTTCWITNVRIFAMPSNELHALDASNSLGGTSGRLRRLLVESVSRTDASASEALRAFTDALPLSTVQRGRSGTRRNDSSTRDLTKSNR